MDTEPKRSGRRRGRPDTRTEILDAAAEAFAHDGFDRSSIRRIATAAGVDPALVHHYFGTKDQLFLAAVEAPFNPQELVDRVFVSHGDVGERLIRTFTEIWDSPAGTRAIGFLRTALAHPDRAYLVEQFLTTQVIRRGLAMLDPRPDHPELRGSLIASQLLGLGMTRYMLGLSPLVNLSTDELVGVYGPTIQRYLTADLADLSISRSAWDG